MINAGQGRFAFFDGRVMGGFLFFENVVQRTRLALGAVRPLDENGVRTGQYHYRLIKLIESKASFFLASNSRQKFFGSGKFQMLTSILLTYQH